MPNEGFKVKLFNTLLYLAYLPGIYSNLDIFWIC